MPINRREFLQRTGLAGMAALFPPPSCERPQSPEYVPELRSDDIADVLLAYTIDTFNGVGAMVVPGDEIYSRTQGVDTPGEPGAVEGGAARFAIEVIDANPVVDLGDLGATLSLLLGVPIPPDGVYPVSLVVALVMNQHATLINPLVQLPLGPGGVLTPFSRLKLREKVKVVAAMETLDANLLALLDNHLPEPLRASLSGLLRYIAGVLFPLAGFCAYSEYSVFDRQTQTLSARPPGWDLAQYQPFGSVEGWDDFRGYFEGRTQVEG